MKKAVITISREYGSGGRYIGQEVAKALGIPFYDKEILALSAESSGMNREMFESLDEKPASSFLYSLAMNVNSLDQYQSWYSDIPFDQKVYLAQAETIEKLAKKGSCVIVGRCANHILEKDSSLVSIFICADLEDRIRREMDDQKISYNKAKDSILRTDKKRSNYYNAYTGKKWGTISEYDFCINSTRVGYDNAIRLITEYIKGR